MLISHPIQYWTAGKRDVIEHGPIRGNVIMVGNYL